MSITIDKDKKSLYNKRKKEGDMMDSTVVSAIIGAIGAIIAVIIPLVLTPILTRSTINKEFYIPKNYNNLERQYEKIFFPLHKIIFLDKTEHSEKIEQSMEIIKENYKLAPIKLIKYLQDKTKLMENERKRNEYYKYVTEVFLALRREQGYNVEKAKITLEPSLPDKEKNI